MTGIAALLADARERRMFSAAAFSTGDAHSAADRGLLGTVSWDGAAVTEDSRWDLASVTKPIVGLAVMSLIETGELTLDDTIADHLPEYVGTDKASLSVRDLLSHSSGLPGQVPLYKTATTRAAMLEAIRELPLAPVGSRVEYSSQGFILLGLIAESASGLSLDALLRERVTAPAGLQATMFGLPEALHPLSVATSFVATEDDPWRGRVIQGEVHDENAVVLGAPAGHAGLFSTLGDLERLGQALVADAHGILSPAGYRAMIRPQTDHLQLRRSLAWQGTDAVGSPAGDLAGPNSYGHTGFTGTSLWVDPDAGRYVVLLTNRVHPSRDGTGFGRLRRQVHNLAFAL